MSDQTATKPTAPASRYDGPAKLNPVPKDIDIAQAAPIAPIIQIARTRRIERRRP